MLKRDKQTEYSASSRYYNGCLQIIDQSNQRFLQLRHCFLTHGLSFCLRFSFCCCFHLFCLLLHGIQYSAFNCQSFMQSTTKTTSCGSPVRNPQHRRKAHSFTVLVSKVEHPRERVFLEQFTVQISPKLQKRTNLQSLTNYTHELVQQIYELDRLGIDKMMIKFLDHELPKFRQRMQERLSLSHYLAETLKYKPFAEVQKEILKQWRKNVIFFSLNTIWSMRIKAHEFTNIQEFAEEYRKQLALITNLSHYYFKHALSILDGKNVSAFCYLQQETAHKILNELHEWRDIYQNLVIPLIINNNSTLKQRMNLGYDPRNLNINPQYLEIEPNRVELPRTIAKIKELAEEFRIHQKIELLKQMRNTFIEQIQQNRATIMRKRPSAKFSMLEKDDIIGCLIYCIVTGKIKSIQPCLQAITELLGPNNELLSRKGVDSYRVDLQCAVGYLCQQKESQLDFNKEIQQSQMRLQLTFKSTHLQFDCTE